jgi:LysR family hca operon transcriptional activator
MELRHLRYFVAVAETESLTLAAKSKLHTSQPSLSRQIRDLEEEIGAQLITRTARGVALTPAGRAFLDHARGVLLPKLRDGLFILPSPASRWDF